MFPTQLKLAGLAAVVALGIVMVNGVQAAPSPKPTTSPSGDQMDIIAKTTTYDGKTHTYQVKGQVKITLPQLVVTCDEATLYASASEDQIIKVVFNGQVEAKKGTDSFKADRITFFVAERRLVAEGTTRTRLKLPARASGPVLGP